MALEPVKQKAKKIVQAWAFTGDCDPNQIRSNSFSIEWLPAPGSRRNFRGWIARHSLKSKRRSREIPHKSHWSRSCRRGSCDAQLRIWADKSSCRKARPSNRTPR